MRYNTALLQLATLGFSLRHVAGEYRVCPRGAGEESAYYTTDLQDAVDTARAIATANGTAPEPIVGIPAEPTPEPVPAAPAAEEPAPAPRDRKEVARRLASDGKRILCRGGRTGRKIHLATSGGSSVTWCGHWMKYNAVHFQVAASELERIPESALCERCIPL